VARDFPFWMRPCQMNHHPILRRADWFLTISLSNRSYVRCFLHIQYIWKAKQSKGRLAIMNHNEGAIVVVDDDDDDDGWWWWSISSSCLFVIRGWRIGISILPSEWVWEPKIACDGRFRALCVFLTLASQKRVYVPERKHVFKKKKQILGSITHYCV